MTHEIHQGDDGIQDLEPAGLEPGTEQVAGGDHAQAAVPGREDPVGGRDEEGEEVDPDPGKALAIGLAGGADGRFGTRGHAEGDEEAADLPEDPRPHEEVLLAANPPGRPHADADHGHEVDQDHAEIEWMEHFQGPVGHRTSDSMATICGSARAMAPNTERITHEPGGFMNRSHSARPSRARDVPGPRGLPCSFRFACDGPIQPRRGPPGRVHWMCAKPGRGLLRCSTTCPLTAPSSLRRIVAPSPSPPRAVSRFESTCTP